MLYKIKHNPAIWKSDRYKYQNSNFSFLELPQVPPERTLKQELNDIFMEAFSPRGIVFKEGDLTISQHLEDLFMLISDNEKFTKGSVRLIRESDILYFIYSYLDFVIKYRGSEKKYGAELLIPCKLIGLLLEKHIFLPMEIADTPIIKTLTILAKSERNVEQAAGVCAISYMIQPSCGLSEYLINKFLPLILSFRTSFNNSMAWKGSLLFIHKLFRYINDIPPEYIAQITEDISDIFYEKKKSLKRKYAELLPYCVDCLRMEILFYPEAFELFEELEILQAVNQFLCSNDEQLVIESNRFFSAVFTGKGYDLDYLCHYINYSSIIDNAGYEVVPDVQISSLWLLIDITLHGQLFIEELYSYNILSFLSDIYPSQDIKIKKIMIGLVTNFLLNASNDQEPYIFASSVFYNVCNDMQAFDPSKIYNLLVAIHRGIQKLSSLPISTFDEIKQKIVESNLIQILNDLETCDLEEEDLEQLLSLSRLIISMLASNE